MKKTRKQRIDYLAMTLAAFLSGAVIYGLLALFAHTNDPSFPAAPLMAFIGGLVPGGTLCGIRLASGLFARKSMAFRTAAAFLWLLTAACVLYVGLVCFFPYGIYNLVKIVKEPKQSIS